MTDQISADDKRLFFLPFEKATTPPVGLIEHISNGWWVTHPEKGLAFWHQKHRSPQCNQSESLILRLASMYPWAEIRFFPSVFRSINPQDYVG